MLSLSLLQHCIETLCFFQKIVEVTCNVYNVCYRSYLDYQEGGKCRTKASK